MRYVYAIITLVLAGVLLVLGVGQQTFLAGPDAIVKDAADTGKASYAVISADTLDDVVGRPVVEMSGKNPFVAVGSMNDIEAWLLPFDHAVLSLDEAGTELVAEQVSGVAPVDEAADGDAAAADDPAASDAAADESALEPIDPRGSDLWIEERSDKTSVSLPVALQPNQGVIIATDGTEPLPGNISVSWMQSQRAPLAGPFLVAGLVFGLAGAVLYLLAVDHDRRGLGPRRGRGGPLRGVRDLLGRSGTKSAAPATPAAAAATPEHANPSAAEPSSSTADTADTADGAADDAASSKPTQMRSHRPARWFAALGLTATLGLTGCSADSWPDFSPAPEATTPAATSTGSDEATVAPVPVVDAQIDRIISDVADIANAADDAMDPEILKTRFAGDALEQRVANYTIRSVVPDYQTPPRITSKRLDYELVQSTEGWPRTLFVVVESSAEAETDESTSPSQSADEAAPTTPSLALVLTQTDPHENFLVTHVSEVRGGITMPPAAPASEGTALLDPDIKTLRLTPDKVGEAYADILQNGEASAFTEDFDLTDDVLLEKLGAAWAVAAQAEADAAGQKVQHSVQVSEAASVPVTLSTGEGGALVSVVINDDLISSSSDPQSKVKPTPSVTALSGITDSRDRIVQHWTHQMLFFVPSADSGELIRVLGATSAMIGAGS